MTEETIEAASGRNLLVMPITEKLGEVFENHPLLASTTAFVAMRIVLKSLNSLFAVGMIAGGLLVAQRMYESSTKDPQEGARQATKKLRSQPRN